MMGETLQFPGWSERKPLQQAERQATWLSDWISSAIGEKVTAEPALVLPGWFIRRTSGKGIPVLTGKWVASYFPGARTRSALDPQLIQRIVHQLDQRCRDVAPRSYRKEAWPTDKR
jgi:hypothetical protein